MGLGKSNIVLIGMPGCGKTTLGKMLSKKIGYDFVDIDEMIEQKFDKIENLFSKGEDYFRQKETSCAKLASFMTHTVIAAGGGIITRSENMTAFAQNSIIIFLDRNVDEIKHNIHYNIRPLLKDDKEELIKLYNERYPLYNKYADIIINTNGTLDSAFNKLVQSIINTHPLSRHLF